MKYQIFGSDENGKFPSVAALDRAEAVLDCLPSRIASLWQKGGGKLVLTSGNRVKVDDTTTSAGYCERATCVVAEACGTFDSTILHEVGHAIDYLFGFSKTTDFARIFDFEVEYIRLGRYIQFDHTRHHISDTAELFAASFSLYFLRDFNRQVMPESIRNYISNVEKILTNKD
jgi:hypothetical protein